MGFLYVALALLFGLTKGYCGKKTSGQIGGVPSAVGFNLVRMLLCIPIGVVFVLIQTKSFSSLAADGTTVLIAAVSGAATSFFVIAWLIAVRTGAYMMVDVFPTIGIIVPIVGCRVVFGEESRWNHIVGVVLLAAAAYVLCTYNRDIGKAKLTFGSLVLLIACGFSYGMISFTQKWFRYRSEADASVFNLYTYIASAVILFAVYLFFMIRKKHGKTGGEATGGKGKLAVYVVIMSFCIFLHSLFSTLAAGYLPSALLYPLLQGCGLILSMIMSAVFFGEKITPRCLLGIGMAFAALVFTNCL